MPIRVFVVDDSEVFLAALREVLDACPDFELVGAAQTGEAALTAVERSAPDLVLVDVILPGIDGLEACKRLHEVVPGSFMMLCSVGEDPRTVDPSLGCSFATFVAKAQISPRALRFAWDRRNGGVTPELPARSVTSA